MKRLTSLLLVLALCLSLLPGQALAADPAAFTRTVGGVTFTCGSQEDLDRIHVDEAKRTISSGDGFWPPQYYTVSLAMDGTAAACPYRFNLAQTNLTLNGIVLEPQADNMSVSAADFEAKAMVLHDRNVLRAENAPVRLYGTITEENPNGMVISGDGSFEALARGLILHYVTLESGSLVSTVRDFRDQNAVQALSCDAGGFTMNGGSLRLECGDYSSQINENLTEPPSSAIFLRGDFVVNGGRVYVDSGTDLRTGRAIPIFQTELGSFGRPVIRGGVFNIGDLNRNTVLGAAVEPGYQVVLNTDPETMAVYPYRVQAATEALKIYPRDSVSHPEKTIQFTNGGLSDETVTWSVSGQNNPTGTAISDTGLLTVAADETADSLTVTARAGSHTDRTTVTLEEESFDIWLLLMNWYGRGYSVVEHRLVKKGDTFPLPQVKNIPGYRHIGWLDQDRDKEYAIGDQTAPATRSMYYWTKLESSPDDFMIGGQLYQLPKTGQRLNSRGGSTASGSWWVERPEESVVELTLNGVALSEPNLPAYRSVAAQIVMPAVKTLKIHIRGDNRLTVPLADQSREQQAAGFYQPDEGHGNTIFMDFAPGSTLTVKDAQGRPGHLFETEHSDLHLSGSGRLQLNLGEVCSDILSSADPRFYLTDSVQVEADVRPYNEQADPAYTVPRCTVSGRSSLVLKGDRAHFYYFQGSGDTALQLEDGVSIVGSTSPDGSSPQTLTRDELVAWIDLYPYVKISKNPAAPPHHAAYPLWLGGVQATPDNQNDILGDGTASYDPDTATLKLSGAAVTAPGGSSTLTAAGLHYRGRTLNIVNEGSSVIRGGSGYTSAGFQLRDLDNLKISGSGTLRIEAGSQAEHRFGIDWAAVGASDLQVSGGVTVEMAGADGWLRSREGLRNDFLTGARLLCSDRPDGRDPQPVSSIPDSLQAPFAIAYQPTPVDIWFLDGTENLRITSPLNYRGMIDCNLNAAVIDQKGLPMDVQQDEFFWAFSEDMSSTNGMEQARNHMDLDQRTGRVGQDNNIKEGCYVGVSVTHIPSGVKKAMPVFLVGDGPLQKCEASIRPGYENKVYREGERFDPDSLIVTRVYPTFSASSPVVRHPAVFETRDFVMENDGILKAGQTKLKMSYTYPEDSSYQIRYFEVPVTVQGSADLELLPGGNRIQVSSKPAATLILASYGKDGRMERVQVHAIPAETKDQTFAFGDRMQAFLLDTGSQPLCPAVGTT